MLPNGSDRPGALQEAYATGQVSWIKSAKVFVWGACHESNMHPQFGMRRGAETSTQAMPHRELPIDWANKVDNELSSPSSEP